MIKKVLCIFMAIILSAVVIGCDKKTAVQSKNSTVSIGSTQGQEETDEARIKELEGKLQDYEKTISSLQEQNGQYKDFINSLVNGLSESNLLTLAKSWWEYVVSVDGTPVPPDGNIQVTTQDFQVSISEIPDIFNVLPQDVISKGKISGNYYEHIKFLNYKPDSADSSSGMLDAISYTFSNISKGSTLQFEISKELQERIGLKTTIINVHVK